MMTGILLAAWTAPLLQALLLLAWRRANGRQAAAVSTALTGCAAAGFAWVAAEVWSGAGTLALRGEWFAAAGGLPFAAEFGLEAGRLSALFAAVVAGLTLVVLVFSASYLRGEPGLRRYYGWLGLFCWAMLGVVLADNLLFLFCFWELVGVSSYFLIGFWREKPAASEGATAAVLYNRVGDAALLAGILLAGASFGTARLAELNALGAESAGAAAAGALICLGVFAKSAQAPFQAWLPGAMAGPTPVSSLLHAATMVAAGAYLLLRLPGFLLDAAGLGPLLAAVGALTALAAALAACAQTDFKQTLAYSTISQLGFMVAGYGAGAPEAAYFHLIAHAAFKCGLFLGAARVILYLKERALHPETDAQALANMGGLRSALPVTSALFAALAAALAGAPLTSGYLSKEGLMAGALRFAEQGGAAWLVPAGLGLAAALTAYYSARLWMLAFGGKFRGGAQFDLSVPVRPAPLLTGTLALLGGCSLWTAYAPFAPLDPAAPWPLRALAPGGTYPFGAAAAVSLSALAAGSGFAFWRYGRRGAVPLERPGSNAFSQTLRAHFYQKKLYDRMTGAGFRLANAVAWFDRQVVDGAVRQAAAWTARKPFYGADLSLAAAARRFDLRAVDGLVNGAGAFFRFAGRAFQRTQSGTLPLQIFLSFALAAAALAWLIFS